MEIFIFIEFLELVIRDFYLQSCAKNIGKIAQVRKSCSPK